MDKDEGPTTDDASGLDRREFVRSAMLVGGASAVSALGGLAGCVADGGDGDTAPAGSNVMGIEGADRIGVAERQNRQHAWDDYETKVGTGNTAQPHRSLVLALDYAHDGEPSPGHRRQVERALREIERHFEWSNEGVLFTMAYSASYFDRFEADLPPGAAPTPEDEVIEYTEQLTPYDAEPDAHDAVLLLAGDHAANLLAVEEALWGGDVEVSFEATFEGVFSKPETWPERRVGFAAAELPKERYAEAFDAPIPEDAPLSMGFIAGFGASIPAEDDATLTAGQRFPGPGVDESDVPTDLPYVGEVGERDPGIFAQGTLKHLSYLTIDLTGDDDREGWYDLDRERRRHQIYSPYHSREETESPDEAEKPGKGLVDDPGGDPGAETADDTAAPDLPARRADGEDYANRLVDTAREGTTLTDGEPTAGHSQKSARARYDVNGDGEVEQPCLRRDWDGVRPAVDGYEKAAGYHFNVPMRFNEGIFSLLDANYSAGFRSLDGRIDHEAVDGPATLQDDGSAGDRNGIAPFMDATRRANYLVPPITLRSLPVPRATEATVERVTREDDTVTVALADVGDLDPGTVRLGASTDVNRARGTAPTSVRRQGGSLWLTFPAADVPDGDLKLSGTTRGTREPVTATITA